ncbi:unnamed protein product [Linum tenue]|uniref:RNase H type-1 domain-containing protein n=1 Tax=Linum tenue TaxID=586396 RepID=A0AAV0JHP6_9ROSI|nr:unnamed protein product [Linum tenue]
MDGKSYLEDGLICRIKAWFKIAEQAKQNSDLCSPPSNTHRMDLQVGWKPPREGWVQVQTDGSVLGDSLAAAAGGLIRDRFGRCLDAFSCNLGVCSITSAELKGATVGLERAWQLGFRAVELNLDSQTAINIIKNWQDDDHQHGLFASKIGQLLTRDWQVEVKHVFRECNYSADFLASKGHCLPFGTHYFDVCDPHLYHWLLYDVMGNTMTRSINMMI